VPPLNFSSVERGSPEGVPPLITQPGKMEAARPAFQQDRAASTQTPPVAGGRSIWVFVKKKTERLRHARVQLLRCRVGVRVGVCVGTVIATAIPIPV